MNAWHLNILLLVGLAVATFLGAQVYERFAIRRGARTGHGRPEK
jgi:hypothetical protein